MVHEPHAAYNGMKDRWARCRDAFAGSDQIKHAGTRYLPALGGQAVSGAGNDPYSAYVMRAMFYPAMARTVSGLAGLVFGKPPTVANVAPAFQPDFQDVTLAGTSLGAYAVTLCHEAFITGRTGTLIDMPDAATAGARPYWVNYPAEAIVNWRTARMGGTQVLTLLVLKEDVEVQKPDDLFTADLVTQYRVLQLIDGRCVVTVYHPDPKDKTKFLPGEPHVPIRRGVPLDFIPFTFLGPSGTAPDVEHPPLVDLVDVNISHYQTSADRHWGCHWCGLPQPWIAGYDLPPGEVLTIGSSRAWVFPDATTTAGMLEFSGAALGALKDLMAEKEALMQVLGAKILERTPTIQEAARTVELRHAGEGSVLGILAGAIGQALTQSVRTHLWWSGVEPATAITATVTMNFEELAALSSTELSALVAAWQAGAVSKKTVFWNLQSTGWIPSEVTFDQQEDDLKREDDTLDLPAPLPGAAA